MHLINELLFQITEMQNKDSEEKDENQNKELIDLIRQTYTEMKNILLAFAFMTLLSFGANAQNNTPKPPELEFVMELKVTDNNGKVSVTNIRLTPEDIETIEIIKSIRGDN